MFFLLLLLWLIFNGRFALDVLISGVIVSGAITWFAMRYCKWYVTRDWRWGKFIPRLLAYIVLLIKEIIKSNLQVIGLILDPKMEEKIHPQMVKFDVGYQSMIIRALLANSITLTPGTITVRTHNDSFVVHALTPEMGADMDQSDFFKSCARLDEYTCIPKDICDQGRDDHVS